MAMERAIEAAYGTVGDDLGIDVAPVGAAWAAARVEHPEIDLWQPDGSHPSAAGTYLAACVLYATIFGASPEGLGAVEGSRRRPPVPSRRPPARWRCRPDDDDAVARCATASVAATRGITPRWRDVPGEVGHQAITAPLATA